MRCAAHRRVVASMLLSALAACTTLGPDFRAPVPAVPTAFKAAPTAPATRLPETWWTLLGDLQLDALMRDAMAASPTLAAAAARTERARAQLGLVHADESPRVTGEASLQRFRTSEEVATAPVVLGQRRAIEASQFGVQAGASWEVDLWGRLRRQSEAAQAQLDAATLDAAGVRLALSAELASAWLQWRALGDEARIVAAARDSRRDALKVVQQRFDAGATQELDLQRARTELANAEAEVAELARRRALLENALATLSGRAPAELPRPRDGMALGVPPAVAPELPAQVLQRRPDLAQAEALLQAASAQIGVAEAAFYPSLRLTGAFGSASEELGSLLGAPARLFSLAPALAMPLFDGGRNVANRAAARAAHAEAQAHWRGRVLQALREVEDALVDLAQRHAIAHAQERAAAAAARALRVARLRYELGASSYLEVTDADRSALSAERALAQTRAGQWLATVQLVKALGGGWAPAEWTRMRY